MLHPPVLRAGGTILFALAERTNTACRIARLRPSIQKQGAWRRAGRQWGEGVAAGRRAGEA